MAGRRLLLDVAGATRMGNPGQADRRAVSERICVVDGCERVGYLYVRVIGPPLDPVQDPLVIALCPWHADDLSVWFRPLPEGDQEESEAVNG